MERGLEENPEDPGHEWFSVAAAPGLRLKSLTPELNAQYAEFYASRLFGAPFDPNRFREAAFAYFDERVNADGNIDAFFDNLGPLALPRPDAVVMFTGLWEWALDLAHSWEDQHGAHLHKGTGYYFAAVRDIALGDLERGFLYMHQAAKEDIRSTGLPLPDRPAVWFITLDARNPNQAYYDRVLEYQSYLASHLSEYRKARRGTLTLEKLRLRRSHHADLLDVVTTIGHAIARVSRLADPTTRRIRRSDFATLLLSQVALELCLVLEELLRRRVTGSGSLTLGQLIPRYPRRHRINISGAEVGSLRSSFASTFDQTLTALIAGQSLPTLGRPLSPRESDLAIVYGIRNSSAHGLERPAATAEQFEAVVPRVFFAIFAALEGLYR